MDAPLKYTVYVMQSGVNKKDVYVAQTTKDPASVVERYNNSPNPKTLTKPLGSMRPLILREDLGGENVVYFSQNDAVQARKDLSEVLLRDGYNLMSKRPFFFGRKKSVKDKQTGKYTLVVDPSQLKVNDTRGSNMASDDKDAFAYGRKKSSEWNDEVASKFEAAIKEKLEKRRVDTDSDKFPL